MENLKELEIMQYECQVGMYFSDIKYLDNGFVVYSDTVEDPEWNFFTGFKANTIAEFEQAFLSAKQFFESINRKPSFLISQNTIVSKEVENHIKETYNNFAAQTTFLTDKFTIKRELSAEYSFREIDNKTESNLFVETFKTSKSQALKTDTYKPLPAYFFKALENSFSTSHDWEYRHFISTYKGEPIGMFSACVKGEYCGLYGGGTYIAHRKKGVFTNLLNFIYEILSKSGIKYYFCLTEKGSSNEKFYNTIGWKSVFDSFYYEEKNN